MVTDSRSWVDPVFFGMPGWTKPVRGEFRWAYEEDTLQATLVFSSVYDGDVAKVMLVDNCVEFRTDTDVLMHPGETGLPVPVVVQTDMCFTVLSEQLGGPVGRLTEELTWFSKLLPDPETLPSDRVGLPLGGRYDTRRSWKEEELRTMILLSRPFYEAATG